MTKVKKYLYILGGIIIVGFVGLILLGKYGARIENYFEQRRAEKVFNEMTAEKQRQIEAEKNDFSGGKTPEETIQMFVKALEEGDLTRTSKLYSLSVPDDLKVDSNDYKVVLSNIQRLILKNKVCGVDTYEISYCLWEDENNMRLILERNPYTNVWKVSVK